MKTTGLLLELMQRTALDGNFTARNVVTRSGVRRRGLYASRFGQLPWEAPLEFDLIARLDGSWACAEAFTQTLQFVIPCRRGESFLYTPDACLRRRGEQIEAVECKPEALLDDFNQHRHAQIRRYFRSLDIGFLVLGENELPSDARHANALVLGESFRRALKPPKVRELGERTAASAPRTFSALVDALGPADARTALARGFVYFDTAAPLGAATPLFQVFQEAHDAADFLHP
jgi:hypothetical protein